LTTFSSRSQFIDFHPVSNPDPNSQSATAARQLNWPLFRKHLLDHCRDGVVFVDPHGKIKAWNRELESITGMTANKVVGQQFTPAILQLSCVEGTSILHAECPMAECLKTGVEASGEYRITGRSGREVKVEITFVPVLCAKGLVHGAVLLVHDYTIQLDLQRQLKDLYEFSTLDSLTQVANRSEFERVLEEYVRAHQTTNFVCSLIICDIDFFKQINDNFNHHIGDQALVAFASLLKKFVRSKDVVARYGGEEFVILCANCDGESAVQRAEEIRLTLNKTPQPMLEGKCMTASFGVSQLTSTDTPTDFFVRADTALLNAKEEGRNRVVCETALDLKAGADIDKNQFVSDAGLIWKKPKGKVLLRQEFRTITPIPLVVSKLRGYIVERDADLLRIEPDWVSFTIDCVDPTNRSRRGCFIADIEFQVHKVNQSEKSARNIGKETYIQITLREAKRKWFSTNATDLAPEMLREIRDFLMIADDESRLLVDPATSSDVVR
jgi:diguanylate cyclase (GGDEF)-like protein/PAS domain S-box-containing protein